jgi:hypothetical protein
MTTRNRLGLSPFTTKIAGFVALAFVTLGGSVAASAAERGTVYSRGPAAKVVAAGPVELHAYSQTAGGSLYTAPAVTGTDRDCQAAAGSATPVRVDQIAAFTVAEGQVACVASAGKGSFELIWHAVERPAPGPMMLAKAGR